MPHLVTLALATLALAGPTDAGEFKLQQSETAREAHGTKPSKLVPTKTEAAVRFFVVEKDKGPVKGVVITMTSTGGAKYYTEETDAAGYGEVLVPVGQKYAVRYLTLGGRDDIAASVDVTSEPKQNIKLTLRFKRLPPPPPFVLTGIVFDTAKWAIKPESTARLDLVAEFMSHKKRAVVEIAGHTDNVGKPKANKELSYKRANACRAYLITKGIDGSRITAVGHGQEKPIVPNDSDENRQTNRRIEVVEKVEAAP